MTFVVGGRMLRVGEYGYPSFNQLRNHIVIDEVDLLRIGNDLHVQAAAFSANQRAGNPGVREAERLHQDLGPCAVYSAHDQPRGIIARGKGILDGAGPGNNVRCFKAACRLRQNQKHKQNAEKPD